MSTNIGFISIPEFPNYEANPQGRVRHVGPKDHPANEDLHWRVVTGGAYAVTLYRDGVPYTRSVKRLVAELFVPIPDAQGPHDFDTVIQLDNNPKNCDWRNLRWRPRWFAVQYGRQWNDIPDHYNMQVQNLIDGTLFMSIPDAAMTNGELMVHIFNSAGEMRPIFPNGNMYAFVS